MTDIAILNIIEDKIDKLNIETSKNLLEIVDNTGLGTGTKYDTIKHDDGDGRQLIKNTILVMKREIINIIKQSKELIA